MTCEHCKDKQFDYALIDNGAACAQDLTYNIQVDCNNAACAAPTFCTCECHYIDITGGAQP